MDSFMLVGLMAYACWSEVISLLVRWHKTESLLVSDRQSVYIRLAVST